MAQSYNRRINLYINGQKVKNDISSVKKEMYKLTNQQAKMTIGSKEYNEHAAKIKKLRGILAQHNKQIGRTAGLWKKAKGFFSAAGFMGGATALFQVIRSSAQVIKEFEKAQSNLAAVLGTTKNEIKELTQDAIKYGSVTKFTATQVSELQTEFAKFGFTQEQIKASTKAALDFAAATNSELGPAAKVTAVALKAFDLSAANAENVTATLAVSTTKSALAFEDFETILSTVGPVAKAYGFTLEDTIALTGKLKDAGFDASSAATATRNIILNLADSNGKLAQSLGRPVETLDDLVPALADLKAQGIDLNETLQLTDKRSVAAFNTFLTAADGTLQLRDGISGVNGELQVMVDTQLDNLAGDITILNSAWQGFILSIEEGDGILAKFARGTIQFLTDSLIKLSNIDLIFKRASKMSTDEVERAYDAMMNLSGKKYQKFQELVRKENELTIDQVILRKEAMIDEIKATGQSQTEAEMLWDEFYKRRKQKSIDAIKLQREEEEKAEEEATQARIKQAKEEAEKIAAERKKALDFAKFLELEGDKQKAAIKEYFSEAGEGAFDAFMAAIEKSQAGKKIDFSMVPDTPEESEESDPTVGYAIEKYKETLDFKLALNQSMYDQGLIGEQQYQDQLTELTRQAEDERYHIKRDKAEKAQQLARMGTNLVASLMDMELQKAGDNEEKKKEIKKKYADIHFAVTAAEIIADTAGAIMEGFRQLGPIGGAVAAAILGATGIAQLAIANEQRAQVKGFAVGGYTSPGGKLEPAGIVHAGEWVAPKWMNENPAIAPVIAHLENIRQKRTYASEPIQAFAEGGFVSLAEKVRELNEIDTGWLAHRLVGDIMDEKQNAILTDLASRNGAGSSDGMLYVFAEQQKQTAQALERNTKATERLMQWQPSVSVEMVERKLKRYRHIMDTSGL